MDNSILKNNKWLLNQGYLRSYNYEYPDFLIDLSHQIYKFINRLPVHIIASYDTKNHRIYIRVGSDQIYLPLTIDVAADCYLYKIERFTKTYFPQKDDFVITRILLKEDRFQFEDDDKLYYAVSKIPLSVLLRTAHDINKSDALKQTVLKNSIIISDKTETIEAKPIQIAYPTRILRNFIGIREKDITSPLKPTGENTYKWGNYIITPQDAEGQSILTRLTSKS
jgi:hypothetical protein